MSDYKTRKGANLTIDSEIAKFSMGAVACEGLKLAVNASISTGAFASFGACLIGAIIIGGVIWYFVSHFFLIFLIFKFYNSTLI